MKQLTIFLYKHRKLTTVSLCTIDSLLFYMYRIIEIIFYNIMPCFPQVRYYSCEALYNIVKVTRGSVLPFFNEIFDALSKVGW